MNIKNWTGERLETFVNSEVAVEHLHRYAVVLQLTKNKTVLDIASGEGYGSNLIAGIAKEVVGVDISKDAVGRSNNKYKKDNLKFIEGSTSEIPLPDNHFDLVVSFETIEHHDKHDEMLSEIKRVLKPDGLLVISSPDKKYYTDKRNFHNKYHMKELYENEFKELIRANFAESNFYYQRATFVSLLIPEKGKYDFEEYKGDYDSIIKNEEFEQMYILAIASNGNLPNVPLSVFKDDELIGRLMTNTINNVKHTLSYKIGHNLLWPFKKMKKLIS